MIPRTASAPGAAARGPAGTDPPSRIMRRLIDRRRAALAAPSMVERETRLATIDEALTRLAEDRYGRCVLCADPIALENLEAAPETPHCARCDTALA